MVLMMLDLGMESIERRLSEKEERLDKVLASNRKAVRHCSNAIKAIHADKLDEAKKNLDGAETLLSGIRAYQGEFTSQLNHVLQEYTEARIVLSAVEEERILSYSELDVGDVPYLNGLLDSVGELKREMYESIRRKDFGKAERYFGMMEGIYDALLSLRFSNAVLPEFRKKQDIARIQIEQARGELLNIGR